MDTTHLSDGLITMVIGMGIVFFFLTILVYAIQIMTKCVEFINKKCPLPIEEVKVKTKKTTSDESEIALAIAIAKNAG